MDSHPPILHVNICHSKRLGRLTLSLWQSGKAVAWGAFLVNTLADPYTYGVSDMSSSAAELAVDVKSLNSSLYRVVIFPCLLPLKH
jgi:hypothetical protein